jgi:hypothetical protein
MIIAYSSIEREVILLRAITDLIDQMVNHSLFQVQGTTPDQNIVFRTSVHQKLFNILLVDLFAKADKRLVGRDMSYLDALSDICNQPSFDTVAIPKLRSATRAFKGWLAVAPVIPLWLPSIERQIELAVPRCVFIEMCGNMSKHSILRQSRPAKKLQELLDSAGLPVDIHDAALALEDFYERFHADILSYHASAIAQMLNDIQWGIYEYLLPEYHRRLVYDDEPTTHPRKYRFTYPPNLSAKFARALFWDLMNDIRRGPIVPQFTVTRYLQMRY